MKHFDLSLFYNTFFYAFDFHLLGDFSVVRDTSFVAFVFFLFPKKDLDTFRKLFFEFFLSQSFFLYIYYLADESLYIFIYLKKVFKKTNDKKRTKK